eukprot:Skav218316  [mRNA]  locus=scaffold2239:18086:20598:+ [translate_table: standard]
MTELLETGVSNCDAMGFQDLALVLHAYAKDALRERCREQTPHMDCQAQFITALGSCGNLAQLHCCISCPVVLVMECAWQLGTDLLSKEEAIDFCRQQEISVEQSPLELLNAIVQGVNAMPFHNLQLLATKPSERQPPSAREAKAAMLQGRGGLCFVKQAFVGHLLEALGYRVEVLSARVTHPGNHVVILAHDVVEKGDSFLVEVGSGYPSTSAVPIFHAGFEQHFKESFLEFRYVRNAGETLVRREHRRGDPPRPLVTDSLGRPGESEGWRRYFDFFWPQEGSKEELAHCMMEVCTMPGASPFLTSLRAVRWVNGRMIAVKDASLLEEDEEGNVNVTKLQGAEEVKQKLVKHFPEVEEPTVDAAVEYWLNHIAPKLP